MINSAHKINRINYSFYDEALVFKMSSDSIFLFDKASVDHFVINQKRFKKFYLGSILGNKYLELLYSAPNGKIQFLKRYYVSVRKADIDPLMFKKAKLDIARLSEYYLLKEKGIPIEIKLNKKELLKHFKKEANPLLRLAKEHKLSFRKEKDVIQLLTYLEEQQQE